MTDRRHRSARGLWPGLAALTLVAHGLHLFNTTPFWDGAAIASASETGRHDAVRLLSLQNGFLPSYLIHRFIGLLPWSIVVYRILWLVSVTLGAWSLTKMLRTARLPGTVATLAGALAVVLPFAPVAFEISLLPQQMLIVSFLAGVHLLSASVRAGGGPRLGRRLAIHALLASSFFYGTCLFLGLVAGTGALMAAGVPRSRPVVRRWLDLALLPFAFLAVKAIGLVPYGRYEGYNSVRLPDAEQLWTVASVPWQYLVEVWRVVTATAGGPIPLGMFILGGGLVVALGLLRRDTRENVPDGTAGPWPIRRRLAALAVATALLYLTVLPHFLVGRRALSFENYSSRDNIPGILAFAVFLAVLLFVLGCAHVLGRALAWVLVGLLAASRIGAAGAWLNESVTMHLIVPALRADATIRAAGVVIVDDEATRFGHLEWLELQHLLRHAFGTETRLALNQWERNRCDPLASCVAQIRLRPGDPLLDLDGARDAAGCGPVVRVSIRRDGVAWPEAAWRYAVATWRGQDAALADTWIPVRTGAVTWLPCP